MGDGPEFLKSGTVQLYSRAKIFRDCARFGFVNTKMQNLHMFYLFWVAFFQFFGWYLAYLVLQNLLTEILVAQKILLENLRWPWLARHLKVL